MKPLQKKSSECRHNINKYLEEMLSEIGGWIEIAQNRDQCRTQLAV
jgi:hypothetical protein